MRGSCPIRRALQSPPKRRYVSAVQRLGIGLVIAFAVAQVIPVPRTNPVTTQEIAAPLEIDGLLQRACYDCHSNETRWPWYAFVAPASWLGVLRSLSLMLSATTHAATAAPLGAAGDRGCRASGPRM